MTHSDSKQEIDDALNKDKWRKFFYKGTLHTSVGGGVQEAKG